MLGTIGGKRRRGWQRMRWLDGVPEAVGVSLSGLRGMVEDRKAWRNVVHGIAMGQTQLLFPRDSNLKDKFIKHFTGPVTFSAECSKHFHRLYHNTRDCSTPAYYKRCARLLTRLAMSPLCTQP
uniref:ALK and LTK ligand 1 n=1 Tax=Varanus komodoensis TaxID=61221 RepID=A0A8D2IHA0_VARKO